MDVLPIAVNLNALPTPAARGGDGPIGTADGTQEGLDFASLLAAGISSQSTTPDSVLTAQESGTKASSSDANTDALSAPADAAALAVATPMAAPAAPGAVPLVASATVPPDASPGAVSDEQATASIEGAAEIPADARGKLKPATKGAAGVAAQPAAIAAGLAAQAGIDSDDAAHSPSAAAPAASASIHPASAFASAPADVAPPAAAVRAERAGIDTEAAHARISFEPVFDVAMAEAALREAALHPDREPMGGAPHAESPSEAAGVAGTHTTPLVDMAPRIIFQPTAVREVSAPVSSPDFAESLSQQVVWMADKDAQVAELHLNPPELGPVEVRLTLSGDEASARFVSPHAEVRAAIESSLVRLRESLAQAGIALGEAFVSAESFREGTSQSQSHWHQNAYDARRPGERASQAMAAASMRRGLIDTFA